jgi:hypothetical protein
MAWIEMLIVFQSRVKIICDVCKFTNLESCQRVLHGSMKGLKCRQLSSCSSPQMMTCLIIGNNSSSQIHGFEMINKESLSSTLLPDGALEW